MGSSSLLFTASTLSQDITKDIVATVALTPGQVLFSEDAILSSAGGDQDLEEGYHDETCQDEECGGCAALDNDEITLNELDEADLLTVGEYTKQHFDELMELCTKHDALSMVDIRKNLFKAFHLFESNPDALLPFFDMNVIVDDIPATLDAAKALRESHSGLIPTSLDDDKVAHLIGILNKYCIPLDEIAGSGLFLYLSKLKHSCTPNASFTDSGNTIWVTAIKPIAVGEMITVDFFNTHYMCVADRFQVFSCEGQVCTCQVCIGEAPDKTRSFKCKAAGCTGIVHPTKEVFCCTECNAIWSDDVIAAVEMEEAKLMTDLAAKTIDDLNKIIETSVLHRFHHIFYTIMETLTDDSIVELSMSEEQAIFMLYRLLEALNYVVPYPHCEKISLLNSIAQAHISSGSIDKAHEAYATAYAECINVFGKDCRESNMFKGLMENTPKSVEEMAAAYGYDIIQEENE